MPWHVNRPCLRRTAPVAVVCIRQRRVTRIRLLFARRAMLAIMRMRVTSNANYLFISLRMQPRRHAASVPIRSGRPLKLLRALAFIYTPEFGLGQIITLDYKNARFASLVFIVIGRAVGSPDIVVSLTLFLRCRVAVPYLYFLHSSSRVDRGVWISELTPCV